MELFKAHNQWASRPADERFLTLASLYEATKGYAAIAQEKTVPWGYLRAEAQSNDVVLCGKAGVPAKLTHWSFGQLCARVEAPASYIRELPATLAVQNINHGLAKRGSAMDDNAQLMFHANGSLLLRSLTSEKYSRIWNHEVVSRILPWAEYGWQPAMPDIRKTGHDAPALYASDHDMFVFLCNNKNRIAEPGNPDGLQRGVIVENSEVGAAALKITRFLYREMCGNHIIWGASEVLEMKIRHVGDAVQRFGNFTYKLSKYLESSVATEENMIRVAQGTFIGQTKEQVLDTLFGMRSLGLSRKQIEGGYTAQFGQQELGHESSDPRTVWGMVQGLTRYSQTIQYADARQAVDRAAGKLMEATF